MSIFDYKTKPMQHQESNLHKMLGRYAFALFWEMGCGKSKPIVDEISCLFAEEKIDCVLIISDKGCYLNWETSELPKHMWDALPYLPFVYKSSSVRSKKEILGMCRQPFNPFEFLPIVCMNVEAFSGDSASDVINAIAKRFVNIYMVVDESTSIKNASAVRTKKITAVGKRAKYRRILTGTPMTQNPLDLYAQMNFLDPKILGFDSFFAFRNRYGVMETQYMGPGRTFQKLIGFKNQEELLSKIAPHCSRLLKTECLDLPPKVYTTRYVELTKEQKLMYDKIKAEGLLQLKDSTATATTALGVVIKLRQLTSGFVKDDDGVITRVDNNRASVLAEVLDQVQGKAIIWCAFKEDVERVCSMLGCNEAVHYYGDTSDEERKEALEQFNDPNSDIRFFVGTAKTGGKSLTLTIANTVIYYSNDYSLEARLQSEDRAHRYGQKNTVTYVDLVSPGTVDETVLAILRGKEDMAKMTLARLTEIIEGDYPVIASEAMAVPDFWAPLCAPDAKAQPQESR